MTIPPDSDPRYELGVDIAVPASLAVRALHHRRANLFGRTLWLLDDTEDG